MAPGRCERLLNLEEDRLTQADLALPFGSPSIFSEMLTGKRHLVLTHIRQLAARFGVSAVSRLSREVVALGVVSAVYTAVVANAARVSGRGDWLLRRP